MNAKINLAVLVASMAVAAGATDIVSTLQYVMAS